MPINLQGSGNIAEGWGPAPQLHGQDLSGMVSAILRNKLLREQQTRENIADTIKNVREERQSAKYLDAMKAAGLVPQDYDAGGMGGAKLGTGLAKMIEDKREADSLIAHRAAIEARLAARGSGRGGGTGGSGGGGGSSTPQTVWDEQGREWRPGPGGRWIPIKPVGGTGAGEKPTDLSKAVKERLELQDQFDILEKKRKAQEAADMTANRPANPFEKSDLYNLTKNRLKQLDDVPGMPTTEPPAVPQRAPAETGDALPTTKPPPRIVKREDVIGPSGPQTGDTTMPPGVKYVPGPSGPQTGNTRMPPATPNGDTDVIALRQQAQYAIEHGADPEAVKAEFHKLTGGVF